MQIIDLRTERQCTPIQIDSAHPRFSWRVDTKEQNWYQESYRIQVWKTCLGKKQCKVWDSGTVLSRAMSQIPYEGEPLKSDSCYSWTVEVKKEGGQAAVVSEEASFETAFYSDSEWNAEWITEPQNTYHLYRPEFKADEKIAKAKLYICGLGHEECVINGKLVTDAVMEAGWTDYNKSCLYCAYDVSELVTAGDNAICVKLGDGMYRVPGGRYVYFPRSYGDRKLLATLRIIYEDGRTQEISTGDDWKIGESPILFCCIYGGEDYDGRIDWKAYGMPDADCSNWAKVAVCQAPNAKLVARQTAPLKGKKRYSPVSLIKQKDGSDQ